MNKKLKKSLIVSTAAMSMGIVLQTTSVVAAPVSKNGWLVDNNNQYYYQNGVKIMNKWAKDSVGKWCFLNAIDGAKVQEGWAKDSTGWCYIKNGYWVDHATWAKDSTGWQYIGAGGYWDKSVAQKSANPIVAASDAVEKAEVSNLQADVDSAKTFISELNDSIPEKAVLNLKINAVVTNFEVSSVTAVDATYINVVFSHNVDVVIAEETNNYDFGENLKVGTAKVQADGKTVLITFSDGDALTNSDKDGYIVKISNIKGKDGDKVNSYQEVLTLYDAVAPKVESTNLTKEGSLQIKFSEPIKGADETSIKISDESGDELDLEDSVDIDKDDASIVTILGLNADEDKDYTLNINGIKDLAGNKIANYKEDFTLEKDSTDPKVESVQAVSLTTLKITFSEPIDGNFSFYIDGDLADAEITAVNGTNKKSFYATFDDEKDDDDTFKIKIFDYEDFAGNEGHEYTKFIKFREATPELESTKGTIKTFDGNKYAVFTFDQAVDGCIKSSGISAVTYVDEDDDEVDLDNVDIKDIDIYDASDDELEDYLDDDQFAIALRGLEIGEYTATLSDGFAEVNDAESDETDVTFSVSEKQNEDDGDVYINGLEKDNQAHDVYYVYFSDKVGPSALETDNYKVDGENIFEKAVFNSSDKTEVKLTVKQGAIGNNEGKQLSSDYKFTTSNIKDIDGNEVADFDSNDVIDDAYYSEDDGDNFDGIKFTDTTGPAVRSVTLKDLKTILVTFDEEVDNDGNIDPDDFVVTVDGDSVGIKNVYTSTGKIFTLTLEDEIDEDYEKIKVGTSSDFDGEDEYGNEGITNSTKTISVD